MTFLVVAEALVPSGSLPGPLELRPRLRGRIARARRYSQISRIAIRHGLLPYLRGRRHAELVVCAILALRVLVLIFRPDQ
ncbi:MAG TPA: hypothetical protein VE776_15535 [Actinomycetota bacterium]|jgi:hypothetical protein|nr:hypothetical protein [Actinomycetota bacterium]